MKCIYCNIDMVKTKDIVIKDNLHPLFIKAYEEYIAKDINYNCNKQYTKEYMCLNCGFETDEV